MRENPIGDTDYDAKGQSCSGENVKYRKDLSHVRTGNKACPPNGCKCCDTKIESIENRKTLFRMIKNGARQQEEQGDEEDRLKFLVLECMPKPLGQSSNR